MINYLKLISTTQQQHNRDLHRIELNNHNNNRGEIYTRFEWKYTSFRNCIGFIMMMMDHQLP